MKEKESKPKEDRFCLFCQKKIDESKPKNTRYCNKLCLKTALYRKYAAERRRLRGLSEPEKQVSKRGRENEGRPSKYPTIDMKQLESLAGLGFTEAEIATLLGVSPDAITDWKSKPEFFLALKSGRLKADAAVVKSLYQKARDGDTVSMIFWLKNRRRDDWRDRRDLEHTGRDGGAIELVVSAMTPDERRQRIQELEMKRVTELPGCDNDDR